MKAELIDQLGDDLRVVNAARVSFDKESWWRAGSEENWLEFDEPFDLNDRDKKLVSYLAQNNHWTPFAHVAVTMRETIPIFLARQRFKHVQGFVYNEVSRRYVDDEPEFYFPEVWRKRSEDKKQGSSEEEINDPYEFVRDGYSNLIKSALTEYRFMLDLGVCPEQARMVLPQSMYTSYYVTGSLAAWARAYDQRTHDHAQKEWKEITDQWNVILKKCFPVSWNALVTNQ